jgi:phospholipase/carboxylesterase
MKEPVDRTFSARLDCHYLLQEPDAIDSKTPLVLTLHGFGQNARPMLGLTARLFDGAVMVAALQGPNQFFLGQMERGVGYGWMTNRHPAEAIRLHHDMVQHVFEEVGRPYGIPRERRVLVGFSQPVGLNYRFAATYPEAVRGVIGICGGLPGDWDDANYRTVTASLLHIARSEDEYYPPTVTQTYAARLRQRAADVEFHMLEGGHQVPSDGNTLVAPWLRRALT